MNMKIDIKKIFLIFFQLIFTITVLGQNFRYTSKNLNLRSGPSTSYQVLATIPSETIVEMAESCDCAWIRVTYNETIGYVSAKYLSRQLTESKQNSQTGNYQPNTRATIKYYTNSENERVQSPTHYNTTPSGATALCRDGTYSFSQSRRGTCSHHGGVASWLR
jgi:uncharacterized protein YgiM (DUF1202 family)